MLNLVLLMILSATQYLDLQLEKDILREQKCDEAIKITTIDKTHTTCVCIEGNVVNGTRQALL